MCAGNCNGTTLPVGPAGADGLNAFTTLTASFVQPAVGSNVTISVLAAGQSTGVWAGVGQPIFIVGGGTYEVISVNGTNSLTVKNLYAANTAAAATIANGGKVSPAGFSGAAGSTGAAGANGSNGTNGTTIIDTDVTTVTTTQTSYAANKTVAVPANTWATVDDIVDVEAIIVVEKTIVLGNIRVRLASNTVEMWPVLNDIFFTPSSGVNYVSLKLKLAMSAAGEVTPIINATCHMDGTYSVGSSAEPPSFSIMYKGAAITGLTLTGSNNIEVGVWAASGTGSSKILFSQVTSYKK